MARLNRKGELFSHLTAVRIIRNSTGTFGSTTLTAAPAAGATTLTVAGITNFAVAESIIVGNGEVRELVRIHASTAPTGTTITLDSATPLQYAHAIGEAVIEQTTTDLGHIADGSVELNYDGDPQDVPSEIQRQIFASATGFLDMTFKFGLLGFKGENICAALGILESRVLGSYTPADPATLWIDLEKIREENDVAIQFLGVRKDGLQVRMTAMAVELDPTAFDVTIARGQKSVIPVMGLATAGILYEAF